MTEYVMPNNWIRTTLDSVVDTIVGGGTPSKNNPAFYSGSIPWMTVKDMNKHVLVDTIDHITQSAIDSSSTNVIPSGTPIVATRMSLGKVVIANFDSAINQDLKALFVNGDIDKGYFVYWYRSIAKLIESLGTGTTVKGVRLEILKGLSFPLAPATEQKLIAAKLDELLAQVDTIKTRLDAIPAILKRFRQSVLAAAVSGRLTEEWRGSSELTGWENKTVLDVVENKPRNGNSPKGVNYETPYKNLTLSATTPGYFVEGKFKYVDIEISDDSYLWVKNGDVLIQRANTLEYVGVSAIYNGLSNRYVYPDLMMKCTPNSQILGHYLHYSLLSQKVRKYFRDNATGTAGNMPKINQKVVCAAPISLPPLEEQTETVRRVEQFFSFADQIERRVKDAQSRVNHLTQSILAKAFRGELTTEWREKNLDLISGVNSAQALLERIKAEQSKLSPTKRGRRKKAQ